MLVIGIGQGDLSGGWRLPLLLMIAITVAELVPGWSAARAWTIGELDSNVVAQPRRVR